MAMKIRSKWQYAGDIFLYSFLGCLSYFLLIRYADIPFRYQDKLMTVQAFIAGIVLFNGVGLSMRYIHERIRLAYPTFLRNKRMMLSFFVITAILLFVSNYILLVSAKMMVGSSAPFRLINGGLYWMLGIWFVELIIISQFMINRFYKDVIVLYKRSRELESYTMQARYVALQNQLNPHFLFNSLNTLISEIEYNPENAVQFTRNLSDTYRYILLCQDKQSVSLNEELEFLDVYIRLHQVRLGNCLFLENCVENEIGDANMPPLTLQLLVENVIKHNIISVSKPMTVTLYAETKDNGVWLCVSNPLHPKQGVRSSGKGLKNLSMRYKLLCNRDIIIEKNQDQFFVVKVPLLYE